eukprot:9131671-Pyramimonas_sp.AAC.1
MSIPRQHSTYSGAAELLNNGLAVTWDFQILPPPSESGGFEAADTEKNKQHCCSHPQNLVWTAFR